MNKTPIIICTRPESRRVRRKVFRKIAGISAIEHILRRVQKSQLPIILAVPESCHEYDDLGEVYDVRIFRGYSDSPLHRMAAAVGPHTEFTDASHVVRITHDDILIDLESMMDLVAFCQEWRQGYGISKGILGGAGVEVIAMENLQEAARVNYRPIEHVSYFVKESPNGKVAQIGPRASIRRDYRLTMDYPEDVLLLEMVLRRLGPMADNDAICAYLDARPWLLNVNRQPLVTLYTCAYNAEKFIDRTILSVLNSGFTDFEYLIVDDGSTDGTLEEVAKFITHPQVRVLTNDANAGLASSSNHALANARGRYVMRVDADDQILPGAVDRLIHRIEETGAAVVYPAYHQLIGTDGIDPDTTNPHTFAVYPGNVNHHAGCAMMNTSILNEIRFKDGLRHWDSLELFSRISKRFKVEYVNEPTFFYRQHARSLSKSDPLERKQILEEIS